jgi:glycolate oxidase FAD binding subunit
VGTLDQAFSDIRSIVGSSYLKTDDPTTAQYAVDGVLAQAVVFPGTPRQVADVVTIAGRAPMALTVWGGGTLMGAGNVPQRLDLVLCTRRMNHVKDVDSANLTITVEAGVRFSEIQARLAVEEDRCYLPISEDTRELICSDRKHGGCFLPLDPPFCDQATIGGILATNATGPRRLLYGLPRDLVLGLRFVTPAGEVIGTGGKTVKNVSGYDITKLMIGSYGSLGVLCEATLRLLPLPEQMQTLLFAFDSFNGAARLADSIHGTQLLPAAVDVLNRSALETVWPEGVPCVDPWTHAVAVALEGFVEPVDRMRSELQTMAGICSAVGSDLLKRNRHREFWHRASHLPALLDRRWTQCISAKFNYPLSQWRAVASAADSRMVESHPEHTLWIHSGSGVSHICCAADGAHVIDDMHRLLAVCRQAGGNLTVLRAPEDLKPQLPVWGRPDDSRAIMARIKHRLDPARIMSPGRFIV